MKHTKLYKYTGQLHYAFNMYDEHDKTLDFVVLWSSPLTYDALKAKVVEDYSKQLGIAQHIKSVVYSCSIEIMEEK